MADETNDTASSNSRRQKLTGFAKWSQWADLTKTMLIEKDVWDFIKIGPQQDPDALWEQEKKIKENRMAVGTATRIIKEGVSNDIFNNIIDVTDPNEIWQKLRTACFQVGQGVVYSILQQLLNYPRTNKPKGFEKPVMSVFANVRFLIKRLQAAITPHRDI